MGQPASPETTLSAPAQTAPQGPVARPEARVTVAFGSPVTRTDNPAFFQLTPQLDLPLGAGSTLRLAAQMEKPLGRYREAVFPYVRAGWAQALGAGGTWTVSFGANVGAVELHRWSGDGAMVRTSVGLEAEHALGAGFSIKGAVQPWHQFSQYRTRSDGRSLAVWGIQEGVGLAFTHGRWAAEVKLMLEQSLQGAWRNDYGTSQKLKFRVASPAWLGISHEHSASRIDATTGLSVPLRLYDSRRSRVALFAEVRI